MSVFTKLANVIFSPVDAAGSKRSVDNIDVQRWGTEVERVLSAFQAGGGVIFPDLATAGVSLDYGPNAMAWIMGDPVTGNNGIYRKVGASGSGSWVRLGDLPFSNIPLTNAGAGTADAIVATSALPLPTTPGAALFTVNIVADNTGNVTVNGKPLRTNSGNEIVPGGLVAGSMPAFVDAGDHYRLLSDQASAAIVAAAEEWANNANDAAERAESAAAGVNFPPILSGDARKVLAATEDEDGYELVELTTVEVATVASLNAHVPSVDPDYYRVAFRSAGMSRRSGGLYRKVALEPSHPGKEQNGNGVWYELVEDEVTPQMLGWSSGDLTPYFLAAVRVQQAGAASKVVLPRRAGGYAAESGFSEVLTDELLVDFQGQKIAFDHGATWEFKGVEITTGALPSTSRVRYATNFPMASVTGVQAGDLFYINNPNQSPLAYWSDTKKECILITSVDAGTDTVSLAAGLNFDWTLVVADNFIDIWRPQKVTFIRPHFHLAAPVFGSPHYAVHFLGLRDIEIISPRLTAPLDLDRENDIYRMGIQVWKCWGLTVSDCYTEGMAYPIGVYGGTRNIFEYRTRAHYCHHGNIDCGDFASDYILDGLHATDCYMALNTHPVFRAFGKNIDIQKDFDVSNWRCIGGGLSGGTIRTSADDTKASAQFQSETPASGFDYLYDDADFYCTDFKFVTTGTRTTKDLFWVPLGRRVYYANIVVPRLSDPTTATGVDFLTFGPGVVSLSGNTFRAQGDYINGVLQ